MKDALRLVFWELTARCNLKCCHCRAEAQDAFVAGELTTAQILSVARDIRAAGDPIMILTGGEPLVRQDFFEIARECVGMFSRVALATNGTLVDDAMARRIVETGIQRVSVSLDGATPATHDAFRGVPGSFDATVRGYDALVRAGMPVQVNATVARNNIDEVEALLQFLLDRKAAAFHVFALVPVGCGAQISEDARLSSEQMEKFLRWLFIKSVELRDRIHIKATCAPQYYRIMREVSREMKIPLPGAGSSHPGAERLTASLQTAQDQQKAVCSVPVRASPSESLRQNANCGPDSPHEHGHAPGHDTANGMQAMTRGCLAGSAVCFLSRTGDVQPCGYLPVRVGNVLQQPFGEIWHKSTVFASLRDPSQLKGKCGTCGYRVVCEGCRARAYAATDDFMSQDPDCSFGQKS
ncbi:MAG: radical SAM protein [Kiritimatiellia bacterium]